jgi:hypothetical protein
MPRIPIPVAARKRPKAVNTPRAAGDLLAERRVRMNPYIGNGRGTATVLPPTKTIVGRGLAHRHLDARQRACLAADVLDGAVQLDPSQKQLAEIFGISAPYIQVARKLSPGKRAAILRGWDPTSFADLVNPSRQLQPQLRLRAPDAKANGKSSISDTEIENMIKAVGIERTLEVAAQVESTI